MADTNNYIVTAPNSNLSGSRSLTASGGLFTSDSGAEGQFNIFTGGNLATLDAYNTGGYLVYDTTGHNFVSRTITAGTGITVTTGSGVGGNTIISSDPSSVVQQVNVQANTEAPIYTGSTLNFVGTGGTSITVGTDVPNNSIDINITSTAGAPTSASYIVQKASDLTILTGAQALGALTTGILKSTTGTGVVSIASPTADYLPYNAKLAEIGAMPANTGDIIVGAGGTFADLSIGAAGTFLGTADGINLGYLTPPTGSQEVIVLSSGTTTQTFAPNTVYIPTATTTVTFSLPVTLVPGDSYEIIGYGSGAFGSGGWTILISGGRTITVGNQAAATTSISSTLNTDSIIIYCVDATHLVANIYSGQVSVV